MKREYLVIMFCVLIFISGCEQPQQKPINQRKEYGVVETMAGTQHLETYKNMTKRLDNINTTMKTRGQSIDDMMEKYKIKKLPVISDTDKLVGIITITDIAFKVPDLTGRVEQFIQSWIVPSWK